MTCFVVDTNVGVVAHEKSSNIDPQCISTCIAILESILSQNVVVVDDKFLILREYYNVIQRLKGAPGIFHTFFKYVNTYMFHEGRVRQASITPIHDERRDFEELPENELDPSDRKFLAVAVVAQAELLNATDSDWKEQEKLTCDLGVSVRQLCPQHASKSATIK